MNRREMIGSSLAVAGLTAIKPTDIEVAQAATDAGFHSVPQPWRERSTIYSREATPTMRYRGFDYLEPGLLDDICRRLGVRAAQKINEVCDGIHGNLSVTFGDGKDVPHVERIGDCGGRLTVFVYYDFLVASNHG